VCKGAIKKKCTPFMLLSSAYALLLHKIYKQEELLIAIPAGNRKALHNVSLVGNITYDLPIRSNFTPQGDLLERVKNALSSVFEHYNYSPVKIAALLSSIGTLLPYFGFDMVRFVLPQFSGLVGELEIFRYLPANKILSLSIIECGIKRYAHWDYHLCFDSKDSIKNYHNLFLECIELTMV
jgi:hypothetical protein